MTATATATIDGAAAASGRLSSVASGVLELVWPMYLTLVFALGAWVLVPMVVLGWQPVTIISGSMAPAVQPGHVVVVEPYAGQELGPGAVVTYQDAAQDRLVTHRISAVEEDGTFTTRGDANAVDDPTHLTVDRIVGVGRLVVPAAGLPALWAHEGRTDLLAMVAVLSVLATGAATSAAGGAVRSVRQRSSLKPGTSGRSRARTLVFATGAVAVVAVLGATTVSRAAFVGAQANAANTFHAATVSAPSGLTIECRVTGFLGASREVTLRWSAVAGADHYEVDRSTSLLQPSFVRVGAPLGATFTETLSATLLSTTAYRVRAVSGPWTSPDRSISITASLLCV